MDKKTILIIDDEESTVEVAYLLLSFEGYEVLTAFDGEEAINLLKSLTIKPNLILLDILMPKVSGFEVCRWIKQQPELKDIPVLFLTAKVTEEDKEEGMRVGCDDYLTKPYTAEDFFQTIRKHLSQ